MTHPVKAFMTVLGYSIIAQVATQTTAMYDLENALFFQTPTDKMGNVGLQLMPMSIAAKGDPTKGLDIILQRDHIVFDFDVNDEIEKAYRQHVSQIALASAGSLLTP